jgi:hypothetical protein
MATKGRKKPKSVLTTEVIALPADTDQHGLETAKYTKHRKFTYEIY